jgi:hypothetical protein
MLSARSRSPAMRRMTGRDERRSAFLLFFARCASNHGHDHSTQPARRSSRSQPAAGCSRGVGALGAKSLTLWVRSGRPASSAQPRSAVLKQPSVYQPPTQGADEGPAKVARTLVFCPSQGTPSEAALGASGHHAAQPRNTTCFALALINAGGVFYTASTGPSRPRHPKGNVGRGTARHPSAGAKADAGNDGRIGDAIGSAVGSGRHPGAMCLESACRGWMER